MIDIYIVVIQTPPAIDETPMVRVGAAYASKAEADAEVDRIEAANPRARAYWIERQLVLTEN